MPAAVGSGILHEALNNRGKGRVMLDGQLACVRQYGKLSSSAAVCCSDVPVVAGCELLLVLQEAFGT